MLSLPPHSSHKMQPLDKTFMGPLKKYLTEETRKRLRMQPRAITHFDITELFGLAYIRVQRAELAISGFRATGIYPVNRHVFEDHDFIDEDLPAVEGSSNDPARDITTPVDKIPDNPTMNDSIVSPSTSSRSYFSPKVLQPIPRLRKTVSNKGRKITKPTILTSSPYKQDLETSIQKNIKKKTPKKPPKKTQKKMPKKKQPKRKKRSQQKENHRLKVLIKVIIQSMIVPMKVLIVPKIKMVNVCIVMGFFLKTFMERNGSNVHHVGSGLMKNVLA